MSPIQQMLLGVGAGDDPLYSNKIFNQQQYIGTGNQITVNNGIDIATDGGLVWIKRRDSYGHFWFDTARGTSVALSPNLTNPNFSEPNGVNNFNSTGFKIGTNGTSDGAFNSTNEEYMSYTFKKQVGFFDIVTYSGNNETAFNVSHNLGVKPGAILIKDTGTNTHKWYWWSKGMDTNMNLKLNTNSEISTDSSYDIGASLTSTHFRVPTGSEVNYQGTYIAYLWADGDEAAAQIFGESGDKPLTKMGSYNGTGGHNDINIGFEPQWILIKRFDANETEHWFIFDTFRGWSNSRPQASKFFRMTASAEGDESASMSFTTTATGFRWESGRSDYNANSGKYLYMAIRRPDNYVAEPETTATNLYHAVVAQSSSAKPDFLAPFAVDFTFMKKVAATQEWNLSTRATSQGYLQTNNTNAETAGNDDFSFDYENGWGKAGWSTDRQAWMFKRGQGLETVVYKGTGVAGLQIAHNLNGVPEMIWTKNRDIGNQYARWGVGHIGLDGGNAPWTHNIQLQSNSAQGDWDGMWNDTAPTATHFTVGQGSSSSNGTNQEMLAILFRSVDGISKVGSYTGNGTNTGPVISLGFEPRFLLIKNADSNGNGWAVFDTVRGLGTSSQVRVWLDGDYAQDGTAYNFITTTSTTFQPTLNNTETNENGSTMIYYAHA